MISLGRAVKPSVEFIQNLGYKALQLLQLDLEAAKDDMVRGSITYQFSTLKAKHSYLKNKLRDITAILRLKNPSLLLNIQSLQAAKK